MPRHYRHSGKYLGYAPLAGFLAGAAAGLPLAVAYADFTFGMVVFSGSGGFMWMWKGFWRSILAVVFGACIGAAADQGLHWVKARNAGVAAFAGFTAGLAALYVAWGAWVYAMMARAQRWASLPWLLSHPSELLNRIIEIHSAASADPGAWAYPGAGSWFWWSVEAAVVVGMATAAAWEVNGGTPFCESCDDWCEKEVLACRLTAADPKELTRRVKAKDFAYLEKLGAADPEAGSWLRLKLQCCPGCGETNALSVESVTQEGGAASGNPDHSKDVVKFLKLSALEAESIRALGRKVRLTPAQKKTMQEVTDQRLYIRKRNVRASAVALGLVALFGLGFSLDFAEDFAWMAVPQRLVAGLLLITAVGIRIGHELSRKAACAVLAAGMLLNAIYFFDYFLWKPGSDSSKGLLLSIGILGGLLIFFSQEDTRKVFERGG